MIIGLTIILFLTLLLPFLSKKVEGKLYLYHGLFVSTHFRFDLK